MDTISYARNGDVHLAYQVVGNGPIDIVWVPGWFSDIESAWHVPGLAWFLRSLSQLGRLILFDKRGMGQSDPVRDGAYPSIEARSSDLLAVLDAAGSERAALIGVSEGGTQALHTAATHPARVSAVVTIGSWARLVERPDGLDLGLSAEDVDRFVTKAVEQWGTGRDVAVFAPGKADDPMFVERWAALERRAVSPSAVEGYGRMLHEMDVTGLLSSVVAPTLVLHSRGDRMVPVDQSRFLASRLADARFVELPGDDHIPFFRSPEVLIDEIERHLIGQARTRRPERRFAAVMFTDIVGSTGRAAAVGDRGWAAVLDAYEELVTTGIGNGGGRLVKSTGDGSLAVFDDPEASLRCGAWLQREAARLGVELRIGLHCGQVELRGDDVGGITVHVAARVAAVASGAEVLVSSTMREVLLGTGFELTPRGPHELKGVPGAWELYALAGP